VTALLGGLDEEVRVVRIGEDQGAGFVATRVRPLLRDALRSSSTARSGYLHEPPRHFVPPAQTVPQPPQLASSRFVSMQVPASLQFWPLPVQTHADAEQMKPAAQAFPQPLQWFLSLVMSTQTPPQSTAGAAQTHLPA
jgi:hypothetical protein